jgi:hypothetical protein
MYIIVYRLQLYLFNLICAIQTVTESNVNQRNARDTFIIITSSKAAESVLSTYERDRLE